MEIVQREDSLTGQIPLAAHALQLLPASDDRSTQVLRASSPAWRLPAGAPRLLFAKCCASAL